MNTQNTMSSTEPASMPSSTYELTTTDLRKLVNGKVVQTYPIAKAPKPFLIEYLGFGEGFRAADLRNIVRERQEWVEKTRPARTRSLDAWVQSFQAHLELEYGLSAAEAEEHATGGRLTDLLSAFPEDPEGAADRVMCAQGVKRRGKNLGWC